MRPAREGRENVAAMRNLTTPDHASMRPAREGRENGTDTDDDPSALGALQ